MRDCGGTGSCTRRHRETRTGRHGSDPVCFGSATDGVFAVATLLAPRHDRPTQTPGQKIAVPGAATMLVDVINRRSGRGRYVCNRDHDDRRGQTLVAETTTVAAGSTPTGPAAKAGRPDRSCGAADRRLRVARHSRLSPLALSWRPGEARFTPALPRSFRASAPFAGRAQANRGSRKVHSPLFPPSKPRRWPLARAVVRGCPARRPRAGGPKPSRRRGGGLRDRSGSAVVERSAATADGAHRRLRAGGRVQLSRQASWAMIAASTRLRACSLPRISVM